MELYGGEKKIHQQRFKEKILTQIKSSVTTPPPPLKSQVVERQPPE